MMVVNWTKYQRVVASIASTEMEHTIHNMVRNYLNNNATNIEITELKNLEILTPNEEEGKQIVKPFNFMENDRAQEG